MFTFAFYANDLDTGKVHPETEEWHHWACVYDHAQGNRLIYRDGEKVASDKSKGSSRRCPSTGTFLPDTWNVEVTLSTDVKAYWGQFSPQQGTHGHARDTTVEYRDGPGGVESWVRYAGAAQSDRGVYLPDVLGGFGAWQAYVSAFATRYVVPSKVTNIPATDKYRAGRSFWSLRASPG